MYSFTLNYFAEKQRLKIQGQLLCHVEIFANRIGYCAKKDSEKLRLQKQSGF
jgi:hypothetical protein